MANRAEKVSLLREDGNDFGSGATGQPSLK